MATKSKKVNGKARAVASTRDRVLDAINATGDGATREALSQRLKMSKDAIGYHLTNLRKEGAITKVGLAWVGSRKPPARREPRRETIVQLPAITSGAKVEAVLKEYVEAVRPQAANQIDVDIEIGPNGISVSMGELRFNIRRAFQARPV
jgi:DNA-binding transcriptional ArsR family regulator